MVVLEQWTIGLGWAAQLKDQRCGVADRIEPAAYPRSPDAVTLLLYGTRGRVNYLWRSVSFGTGDSSSEQSKGQAMWPISRSRLAGL